MRVLALYLYVNKLFIIVITEARVNPLNSKQDSQFLIFVVWFENT